MKIIVNKSIYILLIIILATSFNNANSQSVIKPSHVVWKADGNEISLKKAYNEGINNPNELGIEMVFNESLTSKYSKEQLTFEFKWFTYYITKKSFMDSYTVSYDKNKQINTNTKTFSVSSKRKKISKGWWEVIVIAKLDGKPINFGKNSRFQIYIAN